MSKPISSITLGDLAPTIHLESDSEKLVQLFEKNGEEKYQLTVLFFYPKDNTPGCTLEAKQFSDLLDQFYKNDIAVYGISGGTTASKQKFCKKHQLSVPLLSDPDFAVCQAYGVYSEKSFMGRVGLGIHRTTFIIDSRAQIVAKFEKVKTPGHALSVFEACLRLK